METVEKFRTHIMALGPPSGGQPSLSMVGGGSRANRHRALWFVADKKNTETLRDDEEGRDLMDGQGSVNNGDLGFAERWGKKQ